MTFNIEEIGRIDHLVGDWCTRRAPPEIKKQLDYDYEIDGQAVTLFEVRPVWRGRPGEFTRRPFAKFRYTKTSDLWHIYWKQSSGKWQAYEPDPVAFTIDEALRIIEADRYGCFFG